MKIERFHPDSGTLGTGNRLWKTLFRFVNGERPPIYHELFNADRSRKFTFTEWFSVNGFRQLNIGLAYRIGPGWPQIMGVMTRWSDSEEQLYGLEITVVAQDRRFETGSYYYDLHTGGKRRSSGIYGRARTSAPDVFRQTVESLGFYPEAAIPQFLDFEKTAGGFMLQVKSLDFSPPALYPKAPYSGLLTE